MKPNEIGCDSFTTDSVLNFKDYFNFMHSFRTKIQSGTGDCYSKSIGQIKLRLIDSNGQIMRFCILMDDSYEYYSLNRL